MCVTVGRQNAEHLQCCPWVRGGIGRPVEQMWEDEESYKRVVVEFIA